MYYFIHVFSIIRNLKKKIIIMNNKYYYFISMNFFFRFTNAENKRFRFLTIHGPT